MPFWAVGEEALMLDQSIRRVKRTYVNAHMDY